MHTSPVSDVGESQSSPGPLNPPATPRSSHTRHNGWAACCPYCLLALHISCAEQGKPPQRQLHSQIYCSTAAKKIPLNSAALRSVLPSGIVNEAFCMVSDQTATSGSFDCPLWQMIQAESKNPAGLQGLLEMLCLYVPASYFEENKTLHM